MGDYYSQYDYNARRPVNIDPKDLRDDQQQRLLDSSVFSMDFLPVKHILVASVIPRCLLVIYARMT